VIKSTYPLKLPLSIKKAAQRLAKEDGGVFERVDRGHGRPKKDTNQRTRLPEDWHCCRNVGSPGKV